MNYNVCFCYWYGQQGQQEVLKCRSELCRARLPHEKLHQLIKFGGLVIDDARSDESSKYFAAQIHNGTQVS